MKKIIVGIVSLSLIAANAKAQEILDEAYLECSYTFTQMIDTITQKKSIGDTDMRLLVGKKFSKFYSIKLHELDSVLKSMTETEQISMLSSGGLTDFIQKYRSTEGYKVYTNHIEHKIIFTDVQPPNRILYNESTPKQDWKIEKETKEIAGNKCQKATCNFRGRNYVAWFTNEIPISEGPWKFNGLPGLIVKVYDTQEHYDFELTYTRKIKKEITFNEKDFKEISLKDHIRICRHRIQHPLENFRNVRSTLNPDPKKYDVRERDIK
ncbi:MAG: GLPGLI family protein [Prevotellaceae bacterium]|jgi:GLPGLI family protein|nr:GLPGLI family protein [Prevotellaceae bacterium]